MHKGEYMGKRDKEFDFSQGQRDDQTILVNGKPVNVNKDAGNFFSGETKKLFGRKRRAEDATLFSGTTDSTDKEQAQTINGKEKSAKPASQRKRLFFIIFAIIIVTRSMKGIINAIEKTLPDQDEQYETNASDGGSAEEETYEQVYPAQEIDYDQWNTFSVAGDIFAVGSPVSDYLAKGFTIGNYDGVFDDPSEQTVDKNLDYFYLYRGDENALRISVTSPTEEDVPLTDAIIITVEFDEDTYLHYGAEALKRIRPKYLYADEVGNNEPDADGVVSIGLREDIDNLLAGYLHTDEERETTYYFSPDGIEDEAHKITFRYHEGYVYSVEITCDDYYAARRKQTDESLAAAEKENEEKKARHDAAEAMIKRFAPDGTIDGKNPEPEATTLSDDLQSNQVMLDGTLYALPIPVRTLEAAGFTLVKNEYSSDPVLADTLIQPQDTKYSVVFKRADGAEIEAAITNFSADQSAAASECAVTTLDAYYPVSGEKPTVPLMLPGKISKATTEEEFKALLSKLDIKAIEENGGSYNESKNAALGYINYFISYPTVSGGGGESLTTTFSVSFADGKVMSLDYGILVSFYPVWD
jgi:hypothetical protein